MRVEMSRPKLSPLLAIEISLFVTVWHIYLQTTGVVGDSPEDILDWCLDGIHHKERPGPEDKLHEQCSPWKEKSCCSYNTTRHLHTSNLYNFEWNHCSHVKEMSVECRRHFIQDLCFYECEPNLGPWLVKVDMKIRKERYFNVPLCASDCDAWFSDCKDEYTCVDDWVKKFVWINGKNQCPITESCRKYSDVYQNARDFCETIWDHSFKYTPDSQPCMRIWFNGTMGNPNDRVASLRVEELFAADSGHSKSRHNGFLGAWLGLMFCIVAFWLRS